MRYSGGATPLPSGVIRKTPISPAEGVEAAARSSAKPWDARYNIRVSPQVVSYGVSPHPQNTLSLFSTALKAERVRSSVLPRTWPKPSTHLSPHKSRPDPGLKGLKQLRQSAGFAQTDGPPLFDTAITGTRTPCQTRKLASRYMTEPSRLSKMACRAIASSQEMLPVNASLSRAIS